MPEISELIVDKFNALDADVDTACLINLGRGVGMDHVIFGEKNGSVRKKSNPFFG